jgi:hypothetical protein
MHHRNSEIEHISLNGREELAVFLLIAITRQKVLLISTDAERKQPMTDLTIPDVTVSAIARQHLLLNLY